MESLVARDKAQAKKEARERARLENAGETPPADGEHDAEKT